jgi:hypothetical protein
MADGKKGNREPEHLVAHGGIAYPFIAGQENKANEIPRLYC